MIHLGAHPWSDINNSDWINMPSQDMGRLWGIGPVPVLGYAFAPGVGDYVQATWNWLARHGFRTATVRLWFDTATPEHPLPPPLLPVAFDAIREQADRPIIAGLDCIYQLDNEPNLERDGQISPEAYRDWALEFIRMWRNTYPTRPIASPPIAQDAHNSHAWLNAMGPVIEKCDYLNVHFYWNKKAGDKAPGAAFSPEWYAERYPGKPIIITECGAEGDQRDVDAVLDRWLYDARINRYHVYIMSSPGWPHWNYGVDLTNILQEKAKRWRQVRTYPFMGGESSAEPQPPAGDVDIAALTDVMHRYWATYTKLIRLKDQEMHKILAEIHGQISDYKRITGIG